MKRDNALQSFDYEVCYWFAERHWIERCSVKEAAFFFLCLFECLCDLGDNFKKIKKMSFRCWQKKFSQTWFFCCTRPWLFSDSLHRMSEELDSETLPAQKVRRVEGRRAEQSSQGHLLNKSLNSRALSGPTGRNDELRLRVEWWWEIKGRGCCSAVFRGKWWGGSKREGIFKHQCFFSFKRCVCVCVSVAMCVYGCASPVSPPPPSRHHQQPQSPLNTPLWHSPETISTCYDRRDFYRPLQRERLAALGRNSPVRNNQMSQSSLPLSDVVYPTVVGDVWEHGWRWRRRERRQRKSHGGIEVREAKFHPMRQNCQIDHQKWRKWPLFCQISNKLLRTLGSK